jgi:hypothetical protein
MRNWSAGKPALTWEQLVPGHEFSPVTYQMTASSVSKYLEAVDQLEEWQSSSMANFVPPMAIAACAMSAMSKLFTMPAGAIHTSEELQFCKPVPVGAIVTCHARVGRKSGRGKFQMMTLEMEIRNDKNEVIISGQASIILAG